jgi:hypothetical protein
MRLEPREIDLVPSNSNAFALLDEFSLPATVPNDYYIKGFSTESTWQPGVQSVKYIVGQPDIQGTGLNPTEWWLEPFL